ncbi:hypothetical protein Tco_1303179 [Tanacetum coccineum]
MGICRFAPDVTSKERMEDVYLGSVSVSMRQRGGNLPKLNLRFIKIQLLMSLMMNYMETEDAQDMGRTSYVVHEEKESVEKGVSTEDPLSTAQPKVSTDKPEDSTDKPDEGTDKPKVSTDKEEVSTDRQDEGIVDQNEGRSATQTAPTTTTPTIFGDDKTIAQVLIIMSQNKEKLKEKEKGVELKDVEETESVTSENFWNFKGDINNFSVLPETRKKSEVTFVEDANILAKKLQEEEREMYTIKQRAKFLHDTIAAQRRFLAQ